MNAINYRYASLCVEGKGGEYREPWVLRMEDVCHEKGQPEDHAQEPAARSKRVSLHILRWH